MSTQYKTARINLVCQQGSTFSEDFEVTTIEGTKDITGYFARGKVRTSHASNNILASFSATVSDPSNGIVTIEMEPSVTAGIPASYPQTLYKYDVEVYKSNPTRVFRIVEGDFAVTPEVTR